MRTLEVDWTVERAAEAVLVGVELGNRTDTPRRVRVENLVDGDVLPPRREGVPERGWDADGFSGVVDAEDRLVLGYACRGERVTPPVEVTDEGRAAGGSMDAKSVDSSVGTAAESSSESMVDRAVRELGPARPPAAAVPALDADSDGSAGDGAPGLGDAAVAGVDDDAEVGDTRGDDAVVEVTAESPAPGVDAWLDAVERRVELAERLTDASVAEATDALRDAGGLGGTVALDRRVAADATRLRDVADRASRLAARADVTDVPVEALRRLS